MKEFFILTFHFLRALLVVIKPGGVKSIVAENVMLRHQLIIIGRSRKRSPNISVWDRLKLAFITAIIKPSSLFKNAIIIKPSVLIKFHKALVKKKYSALFSNKTRKKPGPSGPSQEVINVVIEMKQNNPRFGARRIAMQINTNFGLALDKDVVLRILSKNYKPKGPDSGPSWLTFMGHMKDSLWSLDFFRCESLSLKTHWVMVVMDQFTRRIIGFSVHRGDLTGMAICIMFNKIISEKNIPKYLSCDNDPLFNFHRWKANLRILDIETIKSIPYTPTSHPFVERLIRTCRNEILDQSLFFTSVDLQSKLESFQHYFNEYRTHMGLSGAIPNDVAENRTSKAINIRDFRWKSHCRGLFKLPAAA